MRPGLTVAVPASLIIVIGCFGSLANSNPSATASAAVGADQRTDATLPRPRPLPTISPIDWSGFPNDANGSYGWSGRTVKVQPGKPGVIASALQTARSGDTIVVQAGTYHEGFEHNDWALVIAQDGVVLRTPPGGRALILPRSADVKRGIEIVASHVLIQGLDVVGFKNAGIGIGRSGNTVRNIIISDTTVQFRRDGNWHDGIVAYPDNRALGKPSVDGLLLRKVVVRDASLGVSCNAGPCKSWWLEKVKVLNSSGSGSGADAIGVENGDNIVVVSTEVSGAGADGIDLKATRVLVLGCRVHHVGRNGIKLWQGGDVMNTIVHHTGADAALVLKEPGRYRVLHSVMAFHNYRQGTSYSLTAGYDTRGHLDVELANSIFYKTSGGMFFSVNTSLKVQNCIFYGMENGNLMRVGVRGQQQEIDLRHGTEALERSGLGSGNLLLDPQFTAPDRGDFTLRPTSPALNRGAVTAAYPRRDYRGVPRWAGSAPDIGAFER